MEFVFVSLVLFSLFSVVSAVMYKFVSKTKTFNKISNLMFG